MRIHSLSNVLIFPFLLWAGYIFAFVFGNFSSTVPAWTISIPILILVSIYTFKGEIDYWYLQKYPIELDPKIKEWLYRYMPQYALMDDSKKQKFDYRLSCYLNARAFSVIGQKGTEETDIAPYDVCGSIASQSILLTMAKKDFLLGNYDRVFLYKHPFPTPKNQFLHTVECDHEDGVLIFSLNYALVGLTNPREYFNIVQYGYAQAFCTQFKLRDQLVVLPNDWEHLSVIFGFEKEAILKVIGFPTFDDAAIHVMAYVKDPSLYTVAFESNAAIMKTHLDV